MHITHIGSLSIFCHDVAPKDFFLSNFYIFIPGKHAFRVKCGPLGCEAIEDRVEGLQSIRLAVRGQLAQVLQQGLACDYVDKSDMRRCI